MDGIWRCGDGNRPKGRGCRKRVGESEPRYCGTLRIAGWSATDKADVAGESPQSEVLTLGANADQFLADQAESMVYWFSVTLSFGVRELASGKRACVNV